MPSNYHTKVFETISTRRSRLCIGLDPDLNRLPTEYLPGKSFNFKKNIEYFFKEIIYSTSEECCAYKPQAAMFSALGCEDLLVDLIGWVRKIFPSHLIIFDGKRGDIGNTAKHYAIESFERYEADATTVSPYMGLQSIMPFLENRNNGIYVLCKTSNTGSDEIQNVLVTKNSEQKVVLPLYQHIAEIFVKFDVKNQIGLVVGGNCVDELQTIHRRFPSTPLLLPGIGSQGGKIEEVTSIIDNYDESSPAKNSIEKHNNNLVNISRSVIYASTGKDWREAASKKARTFNLNLGSGM
ncbi:orotidine-5'-phosphate decarboxylase [Betaproteobacteria bacterium]|nr:orotidine-5'-phosphate decarboxylase [Betaproteobacteria bacterium]